MLYYDEQHIHTAENKLWSLFFVFHCHGFFSRQSVQFIETDNISCFSKCLKTTYAYILLMKPFSGCRIKDNGLDKGDCFPVSVF